MANCGLRLERRVHLASVVRVIRRNALMSIISTCAAGVAACSAAGHVKGEMGLDAALVENTGTTASCQTVDDSAPIVVGNAQAAEEYGLVLTAQSASVTTWATSGNEALVLEVSGSGGRLIGHVVLHQGASMFDYGMHAGALAAGEPVSVKVSTLSAASAVRKACVSAQLTPASAMGAAGEGLINAPIFRWPVQKRFDDLPVILGW